MSAAVGWGPVPPGCSFAAIWSNTLLAVNGSLERAPRGSAKCMENEGPKWGQVR
jgi:hypothetical protein